MANFMVREQALYVWKARGKVGYLDTTPSNERALARYGTTGCTYRITSTNYPCRKDGHDFAVEMEDVRKDHLLKSTPKDRESVCAPSRQRTDAEAMSRMPTSRHVCPFPFPCGPSNS